MSFNGQPVQGSNNGQYQFQSGRGGGSGYVRGADDGAPVDEERVEELLAERQDMRFARKFAEADRLRDQLRDMGITVWDRNRLWRHGEASSDDDGRSGGGGYDRGGYSKE